uniref:Uncharacterized protein n=1 Tax=Aegilops tauschii subsp. strangulata TaxID=200361 RepID=A0A453L7E6_AEGTS
MGVSATVVPLTKMRTRLAMNCVSLLEPTGRTRMSAPGLSRRMIALASSTGSPTTSGHDVFSSDELIVIGCSGSEDYCL